MTEILAVLVEDEVVKIMGEGVVWIELAAVEWSGKSAVYWGLWRRIYCVSSRSGNQRLEEMSDWVGGEGLLLPLRKSGKRTG
jgi:hypothetical protein